MRLTSQLEQEIVASIDHLDGLINAALSGQVSNEQSPRGAELLERLAQLAGTPTDNAVPTLDLAKFLAALEGVVVPGLDTPVDWLGNVAAEHLDELAGKLPTKTLRNAGMMLPRRQQRPRGLRRRLCSVSWAVLRMRAWSTAFQPCAICLWRSSKTP